MKRRTSTRSRPVDEEATRPVAELVFGFGDPRGWPGTPEHFQARALAWFKR